ncbi:alpha/beta hydrolase [Pelomonas sp. SE-A7]|uniref:alpha/beta fold hydrolase n=1 Tax=Pelomonas sp. SE-A7 TaxID=3054953 RepID=UPI00259C806D|nr:alpha/beta hydrolase [Pelomonas sp. SE-A7]MDM4768397.1 alpha/beta hydrolase [Pelomonas sp. SE-A7]
MQTQPFKTRAPWFILAIAIIASLNSSRSEAATPATPAAAPAATSYRDLQVQVVGTGKPVLMIPGLNSAASVWTETCAALQPQVQCHIVQLPGFAGAKPVQQEQWLNSMRQQLQSYVDDKKLAKPVVMGHSLGGALALMLGSEAPQRFERLVIVDALAFIGAVRDPNATAESLKPMLQGMRQQMAAASDEQAAAQVKAMAPGMTNNAQGIERVVAWGLSSDRATTAQAMTELWGTDLRPQLSKIQVPTLVLGSWAAYKPMGATQESTRKIFETQYANLKGVDIRMSEAGYHFLMWDDADWLVGAVKGFIAQR